MMNHLWQSTLFAVAAGLLTLAFRRNRANVRYALWFGASCKFLIPLALLMGLGAKIPVSRENAPPMPVVIEQVTEPFAAETSFPVEAKTGDWGMTAMIALWACGCACLVIVRIRGWRKVRAAVRASVPMKVAAGGVQVRCSPGLLEPGVAGLWRPVLLVPEGIGDRLTPEQLEAVLAHELCHVKRRDNLTSAIHMVVEILFWFHPLVWWIGARLMQERERACDEAVLSLGSEPQVYAEAILNVCKLYVESPLACVSGVTGSDLRKRIEAIVANRAALRLNFAKKAALAVAGIVAVGLPIAIGIMNLPRARAEAPLAVGGEGQRTPVRKAAPAQAPNEGYLRALGAVTASTATVRSRVDGTLLAVNFKEGEMVQAGQLLASIDPRPFELDLEAAEGKLAQDRARIAEAKSTHWSVPKEQLDNTLAQLEGAMRIDQAADDQAKLRLTYARIAAPMAGIVGLRQVDVGNVVYSAADATPLVVITQLQPISVVFGLSEENLPQLLARQRAEPNIQVEAWNREFTAKLATGRLIAVDNQIDPQTGTVKAKAAFDNKDGVLYPNQFVNVRVVMK